MNPLRFIYLQVRDAIMTRGGLQPKGTYWWSRSGVEWSGDESAWIELPNLSGGFHVALKTFWDAHGLGRRCLLVSENPAVRDVLAEQYAGTEFVISDLHSDLMPPTSGVPDIVWDVCDAPPPALSMAVFDSVVCNALLEHVLDPVGALKNLASLLAPNGHLYAFTCTPSFHLHRYPRDYVRFHLDFFEDLPCYLRQKYKLDLRLEEIYARRGVVAVCYERLG
jgi:SAM-dependent methyltransferase